MGKKLKQDKGEQMRQLQMRQLITWILVVIFTIATASIVQAIISSPVSREEWVP